MEFNVAMEEHLKQSREQNLKEFHSQYMAKRMTRAIQAQHNLEFKLKQEDNLGKIEILPPINIKVIEYDRRKLLERPKSHRRPRRDQMPRKNTPPPEKSKAKHHLLPWRVCLTDSEKSEVAKSELAER